MSKASLRSALLIAGCASLAAAALSVDVRGYTSIGHTWGTSQVIYFVNPANVSQVSASEVIAAVQRGAAPWSSQSRASVQLVYGGTTSGGSLALNNRNEVFFRNDGSGFAGETYWWFDYTNRLVDFDIVLHEGTYRFFGSGDCSGAGIYLDDLLVHEFGHGLGLDHSGSAGATMQPMMPSYCDTTQMTLEQDDVSGIEALYPPGSAPAAPAPPAAPGQLAVSASGSSPTSALVVSWADQSNNELGFRLERSPDGFSFAQIAQVAANVRSYTNTGLAASTTYHYRVRAYNGDGTSAYSNIGFGQTADVAALPPPPTSAIALSVSGTKVRNVPNATLGWSGSSAASVDIYRDGSRIKTATNTGSYVDIPKRKGGGTFRYQVCEAGTSACSNTATVTF